MLHYLPLSKYTFDANKQACSNPIITNFLSILSHVNINFRCKYTSFKRIHVYTHTHTQTYKEKKVILLE